MKSLKKRIISMVVLAGILAGGLLLSSRDARADLLIAPLRVVFEDRTRSAIVNLVNTSATANTYRIEWRWLRMDETGRYRDYTEHEKDPYDISKMVIYSPRQVVIEPNGRQRIRLSLRRPPDLPPGEYYAHMSIARLPQEPPPVDPQKKEKGMKMQVMVKLGFSIPVIVRQGGGDELKVEVSEAKFKREKHEKTGDERRVVDVLLKRTSGNFSSYGKVKVFAPDVGGKGETQIGILNNVAIFPEITQRTASVPVSVDDLPAGTKLRISYEGANEYAGRIFDERVVTLKN